MTASKTSNWSRVKFGDVVRNVNATTKDPASIGLERVVGLDHMDPESLPLKRWDELSDLNEGTSFTRIFRSGQVLFGKRRAYQKKVSVPDFDGICSGDILVFEPSSDLLLPDFLPYIVQSDGFFEHALGTSAGSLSPRTKWQELAKYEFVLPPVEEQRRIASILEVANLCLEKSRSVDIDQLKLAVMSELFESSKIPKQGLGNVVTLSMGGIWGSDPGVEDCDVEIVRQTEFTEDSELTIGAGAQRSVSLTQANNRQLQRGDILVQKSAGTPTLCGRVVQVRDDVDHAVVCSNFLHMFRVAGDRNLSILLYWCLWYIHQSGIAFDFQRGTSIRNLDMKRYLGIAVPIPDGRDLQAIVSKLESMDALAQSLKEKHKTGQRTVDSLRESLLTEGHHV